MAPVTFHLVSVADGHTFVDAIRNAVSEKPYYVGRCQHWIHSPKTSLDGLTGKDSTMQRWDYLIIADAVSENHLALPAYLEGKVTAHWSVSAPVDDSQLATLAEANGDRQEISSSPPNLPPGWSTSDYSGLTASSPPSDLEASLALSSTPLGGSKQGPSTDLKSFITTLGTTHPGPISMFNIVACNPGQRARFFGYVAAFNESTGSRYGGQAQFLGAGVTDWSSRKAEGAEVADPKAGGSGVWEDVALVWYPSLWHFGKMLDDPDYADADRKFKVGVIHDNPILCCTEVVL